MKKVSALLLAVVMLFSMCLSVSAVSRFPDVTGHWAESYIEKWADAGVINGYPDGSFHPDQYITRAEVAKVLALAYEMPGAAQEIKFSDVQKGLWYYDHVQACAANNIVVGYPDGSFRPDKHITRSEAVKMVCLAAGLTEQANGLEGAGFKDADQIPDWAKGYWNALYHVGVIDGYLDRTLRPQQNITRAELIKILCKAFSEVEIYKLSVTVRDSLGNSVSDSASYLTGDSRVVETLIPLMVANRENFAAAFPSKSMRDLLDEGIALAQAGYANGWTAEELAAWEKFVDDNFGTVQGDPSAIAYVSNVTSTINTMKMDVAYELTTFFDQDADRGDIYYDVLITVSIME